MIHIVNWLEAHKLPCLYEKYLGVPCPGCGMQTALIHLLRGQVLESLRTYPPLIPLLMVMAFLIFHLIFRFKSGTVIIKVSVIITASIMAINYIFHLLTL
jgi:hypothetical protein